VKFDIIRSEEFREQFNSLCLEDKKQVAKKVGRILQNPYHYKTLQNNYSLKLFRVRLRIQNKEARLVYIVKEPEVILDALVFRKHDYKDLDTYLKRFTEDEA